MLKIDMKELVNVLKKRKLTICSCESLTGGLFATRITSVSGASKVFVGSYVTYQDIAKEILLDGKDILNEVGAVSEKMAYNMAIKTKEKLRADIAISFTGNAGPLPSEGKEVGLVYSCIIIGDKVYEYEDHYKGTRNRIRNLCIYDAKQRLLEKLS